MEKTNFIIISSQRTGSSHLCHILDGHSQIDCYFEIFHGKNPYHIPKNIMKTTSCENLNFFLMEFFKQNKKPYHGFKLMMDQLNPTLIDNSITKYPYKILFLTRKNRLEMIVSYLLAKKTNMWYLKKDEQFYDRCPNFQPLLLDINKISKSLDKYKKKLNEYEKILQNKNILRIEYETLFQDKTIKNILSYLEVDFQVLPLDLRKKINTNDLYKKLIINYDEINRSLGSEENGFLL